MECRALLSTPDKAVLQCFLFSKPEHGSLVCVTPACVPTYTNMSGPASRIDGTTTHAQCTSKCRTADSRQQTTCNLPMWGGCCSIAAEDSRREYHIKLKNKGKRR
ncbi:unnamed protein product, partial [Sphacelaria rigidula]